MSVAKLKAKLQPDRKKLMVSIRMPEDVVEELKRIAPLLGFSGYQPLMRAYIGQGLRADLERLDQGDGTFSIGRKFAAAGSGDEVLATAVAEAKVEYRTD